MSTLTGRLPAHMPAELPGYSRHKLIGQNFPGIVENPGACVDGLLYLDLTDSDFEVIDAFEDGVYTRRIVNVEVKGKEFLSAQTYTVDAASAHLLEIHSTWSLRRFISEFGDAYVDRCIAFRTVFDQSN